MLGLKGFEFGHCLTFFIFLNASLGQALTENQLQVVARANEILDYSDVTYIMGGSSTGSVEECYMCIQCLKQKKPSGKSIYKAMACPICKDCSLDCSHFTQLVYRRAGMPTPYLTTKQMLGFSERRLAKDYHLFVVPLHEPPEVGDLLVYRGHVVILERPRLQGRGDIVHATGGKVIKDPGQGIQRERNIVLSSFRGPLLRILRHKKIASQLALEFKPRTLKRK